ncbi:MAG: hypothetical protein BWY82_01441 [Verrucomicrobia bacterium ADurb.Bin474]|nr:MAG: hypothetical protein BWY82_01441 [Verrucomicrobia bacterium ADurb.Bin474]
MRGQHATPESVFDGSDQSARRTFLFDHILYHPGYSGLSVCARHTEQIQLLVRMVVKTKRHPSQSHPRVFNDNCRDIIAFQG